MLATAVEFDEANPANTRVDVQIEVASVNTREEKRDAHLKSPDFFDAEKYPYMTFKSKRVEVKDAPRSCRRQRQFAHAQHRPQDRRQRQQCRDGDAKQRRLGRRLEQPARDERVREALAIATGQNPQVAFARQRINESFAEARAAETLWVPSLRAGMSETSTTTTAGEPAVA